jgi:hypothetical protein
LFFIHDDFTDNIDDWAGDEMTVAMAQQKKMSSAD